MSIYKIKIVLLHNNFAIQVNLISAKLFLLVFSSASNCYQPCNSGVIPQEIKQIQKLYLNHFESYYQLFHSPPDICNQKYCKKGQCVIMLITFSVPQIIKNTEIKIKTVTTVCTSKTFALAELKQHEQKQKPFKRFVKAVRHFMDWEMVE